MVELLSGTVGVGKINIGTSSLDTGFGIVVGETQWLGLSLLGDEVRM